MGKCYVEGKCCTNRSWYELIGLRIVILYLRLKAACLKKIELKHDLCKVSQVLSSVLPGWCNIGNNNTLSGPRVLDQLLTSCLQEHVQNKGCHVGFLQSQCVWRG